MPTLVYAWSLSLVMPVAAPVPVGEEAARAVLERAIRAHGGAEVLVKYPAMVLKGKGKLTALAEPSDCQFEVRFQAPDRDRVDMDIGGVRVTQVLNGKAGWWKEANDATRPMNPQELAEAREELHLNNVLLLLPLREQHYKLIPLPEDKVAGRPVAGVRVQQKGYGDINLYFDKDSGLLVGVRRQAIDGMGAKHTIETTYSDYRPVLGRQVAHKLTIRRDGKRYLDADISEVQLAAKLNEDDFGKP